jgi:hypothetical protein
VNAEFQWWLLILGIVIGGGLVYLVMADLRTDEDDGSTASMITDPDTGEAGDPSAPERATGDGDDRDRSQAADRDLGTSDQPGPTIPT